MSEPRRLYYTETGSQLVEVGDVVLMWDQTGYRFSPCEVGDIVYWCRGKGAVTALGTTRERGRRYRIRTRSAKHP